MATAFGDYVLGLYAAIYKRAPDKAGYQFWTAGSDLNATAEAFATHTQWTVDFPSTLTDAEYVDKIYLNVLNIAGDASGRAYWTDLISTKAISRTDMVAGFVKAVLDFDPAKSTATGADLTNATSAFNVLSNKIAFSNYWINSPKAIATGVDTIGSAVYNESVSLLASVKDAVTLMAAKTAISSSINVLTTTTDNISGTDLADAIIGDFTPGVNTLTLNVSDQINGGLSADTLRMYGPATTAALPFSIANIETLEFVNPAIGAGVTLDTSQIPDVTTVQISQANTNIASSTASPMIKTGTRVALQLGTAKNTTAPTHTWLPPTTDKTLSLILNGFGQAQTPNASLNLSGVKATTLNINSIGDFNGITLTNTDTLSQFIITGDKSLRLVVPASPVLSAVNASTSKGGVSVDLSSGTTISSFTFKGGSGNDTLILAPNELTALVSGKQLSAAAGAFDVLRVNDVSFTAAAYTAINQTTGFEWLTLAANKTVLDVSQVTAIKNIGISAEVSTVTLQNGNANNSFFLDNSKPHGVISIANQADLTTTVTVDNGSGTTVTTDSLNIGIATQITLTSSGISTLPDGKNIITSLSVADNSTVFIAGNTDLELGKIMTSSANVTIDANAFTGKLTVMNATFKDDTLIGGKADDTLSGGLGADTLTGGAGVDSFILAPTIATGAGDTITDFASSVDNLVLKKSDFIALSSVTGSGFSTASDFVTLAGGVATTATDRIIFDSTSKIVYYDADGSGAGAAVAIVTLTGVTTLAATDFVIAE